MDRLKPALAGPLLLLVWCLTTVVVVAASQPALAYPSAQRPLTACDFVSPTIGWVVGERGVVLRTVTRGRLWHRQRSPAGRPPTLLDVSFADRARGWAIGAGGIVLATRDAGATWVSRSPARVVELRAVAAVDRDTVVAVGWSGAPGGVAGEMLRSTDGGATWTVTEVLPGVRLRDVAFADARHGWAVGSRVEPEPRRTAESALVLRTVDGGETWSETAAPGGQGGDDGIATTLFAVAALDATKVWCAGRSGPLGAGRGLLAGSSDGGAGWRVVLSRRFTSIRALAFGSRSRGWAVGRGSGAAVLTTVDGGARWRVLRLPRGSVARAVDFIDGRRGWIVGDTRAHKGLVLGTVDAGRHWTRLR